MPVITFTKLLNWRVQYEEEKQKRINDEMDKTKMAADKQAKANKPSKMQKYK